MIFKELKKGLPVYILNKNTLEYNQGKVIQDATPQRMNPTFGQGLLTDVSIEAGGVTKIWTLPADQKVAEMQNDSDTIIAIDKSTILAMVKSIHSECESYLEGVPHYEEKLEKAKGLISELDQNYKQQQQTEERFTKIEQSIDGIQSALSEILKAVKK